MSKRRPHDYFLGYTRHIDMGNEISPAEVEGGKVYSVIRKIDSKKVENYEHRHKFQWGIFVTNQSNKVILTYNIHTRDSWHWMTIGQEYSIPSSYHIFPAEWEDRCFAMTEVENARLQGRIRRLQESYDETKLHLNRLQSNPLIRFITRFIK